MGLHMDKIAIIGSGLIGSTWATVFAQAGHQVQLYDASPEAEKNSPNLIKKALRDLEDFNLLKEEPDTILSRISFSSSMSDTLAGAGYVQECVTENLELKKKLFKEMDAVSEPHAILASATSTIPGSQFTEELSGRDRCIIAHPSTPPHILPLVEICPAPWTSSTVIDRTQVFLRSIGHETTLIKKEIDGFILNRLQASLVCEAYRLWQDGYASAEDIEKTVKQTLGVRWALMGPFETIALNAPNGLNDYLSKFGDLFYRINSTQHARPFDAADSKRLEAEWLDQNGDATWDERRTSRDQRLLALVAHKRQT